MSIPVIGFFNNKGGVGKTSLVYHLSWMFSDMGLRVLAADMDPQCNLTAAFIDEDRLANTLYKRCSSLTIYQCLRPLLDGEGDISNPEYEVLADNLALMAGDMKLSRFEDELSQEWPKCLSGTPRAFKITCACWRIMQKAAAAFNAAVILVDMGPNLGAINRAALIGTDHIVIPLGPDLFSLQGLENLGPVLSIWRKEWRDRMERKPAESGELPAGAIHPIGYVVIRHAIRLDRPVQAFDRWIAQIPKTYATSVLGEKSPAPMGIDADPNCLAKLRDYRSLMPLAQEARKPMFHLRSADGALGAHLRAAGQAGEQFRLLATEIAQRGGVPLPAAETA